MPVSASAASESLEISLAVIMEGMRTTTRRMSFFAFHRGDITSTWQRLAETVSLRQTDVNVLAMVGIQRKAEGDGRTPASQAR